MLLVGRGVLDGVPKVPRLMREVVVLVLEEVLVVDGELDEVVLEVGEEVLDVDLLDCGPPRGSVDGL